jgi:hypothetical protein
MLFEFLILIFNFLKKLKLLRYFNFLCSADSDCDGGYFFIRAKHIIGHFKVFFEFFDPQIVLMVLKGNFSVKKTQEKSSLHQEEKYVTPENRKLSPLIAVRCSSPRTLENTDLFRIGSNRKRVFISVY